jgi:gamma-glutamylcyclotransferase (GGCT)/AIG2-like uncharacterized protein YtfP
MPDCSNQTTQLFVYGSLMPGHFNYCRIERHVRGARHGRIPGILIDLGAFPALLPGDGIVEGVALEIDPTALTITDRLEGYTPDRTACFYVRKKVIVDFDDGEQVTAWTYELGDPRRIEDHPRLVVREVGGVAVHAWRAR